MSNTLPNKKKLPIKKGDLVKVIAGNYKNKTGKVLVVYPVKNKALVEGVNLLTHYIKADQNNPKGGIEKKEGAIHISNLMLIEPDTQKPTRIGRKLNEKNKLQRYSKKTGQFI
ncbi:MAG: 50S ribosomal protein L24 [Bacteroidota bacterium]